MAYFGQYIFCLIKINDLLIVNFSKVN